MPTRASTPCRVRLCPGIVRSGAGECSLGHPQRRWVPLDLRDQESRPSAARRGYDARWKKLRIMFLRKHPLCVDPFGIHATPVAATDVDHILPLRRGGSNRDENLQALCHSCHSMKTRRERDNESSGSAEGGGVQSLATARKETAPALYAHASEIT